VSTIFKILESKLKRAKQQDDLSLGDVSRMVGINLGANDYIVDTDGVRRNIYDPEISFQNILEYFKARMPWIKFQMGEALLKLDDEAEIIRQKNSIFGTLIGMLEQSRVQFNGNCQGQLKDYGPNVFEPAPEWSKDGNTHH